MLFLHDFCLSFTFILCFFAWLLSFSLFLFIILCLFLHLSVFLFSLFMFLPSWLLSVFLSFYYHKLCLFLHLSVFLILCSFQHDFYLSIFLSFLFYLLIYEYHEVSQKQVNMYVHHHLWDFPFIPSQTLQSNRIWFDFVLG